MYLLRSRFASTDIRTDHPNAVLDDIFTTLLGQTSYFMEGVDYETTSKLRTVTPPYTSTNPPNVNYITGIKRFFYKRGRMYGIHTNRVLALETSEFINVFTLKTNFVLRELSPLRTCIDYTLPFDNTTSYKTFFPKVIYGD